MYAFVLWNLWPLCYLNLTIYLTGQVHNCCKCSKDRKGKIEMKKTTKKKTTKNNNCKLRKGLAGFNEHIKALRFLTCWLFTISMSSLFGSGDLTIIKQRLIVWWLLLVNCFTGYQAGRKINRFTCNFSYIYLISETDFNQF